MNILFVYSQFDILTAKKPLRSIDEALLGISYISAVLKQAGHQTKLIVTDSKFSAGNLRLLDGAIKEFRPGLVCFTAIFSQYPFARDAVSFVKEHYPDIYTIIGGPYASLCPDEVISDPFDALCRGEGEYPALELVKQLERGAIPSGISNLWMKKGDETEINPAGPFISDLDALPFPDRDMWAPWVFGATNTRCSVLLGRGCPYNCTYCINHAYRKLAAGKYVRSRSPQNISEEIKQLALISNFRWFHLEIETIGIDMEWLFELCGLLREFNRSLDTPPQYAANLRITPAMDYETVLKELSSGNIVSVNIGLESGSDRIRREILGRNYRNEDIINAVKTAKKYGISSLLFIMMALPEETADDFKQTIRVLRECQPQRYVLYVFYPYPGTRIHEYCLEKGLLSNADKKAVERVQPFLNLPGFPKKEIEKYRVWLDYYVYKDHRPMPRILLSVMKRKFSRYSLLGKLYVWLVYKIRFIVTF